MHMVEEEILFSRFTERERMLFYPQGTQDIIQ